MVNHACGFSQSESGKYFKRIIKKDQLIDCKDLRLAYFEEM